MFCEKCGKELKNDAAFCEYCGTAANNVKAETAATYETPEKINTESSVNPAAEQSAGSTVYTPPKPVNMQVPPNIPNTNPQVINNFYQQPRVPVSIGGWIGRSLIMLIPIVGPIIYFIMLFIWSGDNTKEVSFNNWAKAQLWFILITVFIAIAFIALITATIGFGALGGYRGNVRW